MNVVDGQIKKVTKQGIVVTTRDALSSAKEFIHFKPINEAWQFNVYRSANGGESLPDNLSVHDIVSHRNGIVLIIDNATTLKGHIYFLDLNFKLKKKIDIPQINVGSHKYVVSDNKVYYPGVSTSMQAGRARE